jgi:hypothetical protein
MLAVCKAAAYFVPVNNTAHYSIVNFLEK